MLHYEEGEAARLSKGGIGTQQAHRQPHTSEDGHALRVRRAV